MISASMQAESTDLTLPPDHQWVDHPWVVPPCANPPWVAHPCASHRWVGRQFLKRRFQLSASQWPTLMEKLQLCSFSPLDSQVFHPFGCLNTYLAKNSPGVNLINCFPPYAELSCLAQIFCTIKKLLKNWAQGTKAGRRGAKQFMKSTLGVSRCQIVKNFVLVKKIGVKLLSLNLVSIKIDSNKK